MPKNAVVVLTRGYNDSRKYKSLITRNRHIAQNFYLKLSNPENFDIILFHEGNITPNQQKYIQSQSPNLPLQFRTIPFQNNNTLCSLCPPTEISSAFSMGYKNMCYFWSINFLEYLKDYEYILRIDEDCLLQSIPIDIFETYKKKNIVFSSPYFQGDDDSHVIVGMKRLFVNYMKKNGLQPQKMDIRCPYTNVTILNISHFRSNQHIQNILNLIKTSNCIFSNRWGDLPIWGHILTLLIEPTLYLEDTSISYFHGSHDCMINKL